MSLFRKIRDYFGGGKVEIGNKSGLYHIPNFTIDQLTEDEKQYCYEAKLTEEEGLAFKSLTKSPLEKLEFEQEYSEGEKPNAIWSFTTEENARKLVLENLEKQRKNGNYIFISEIAHNECKIGLTGSTSDPYKLMELAETNGANYDLDTSHIIEKYKKWDKEFGIIPIGIGFDFCECQIKNKNLDYKKLAKEVYEFCPDSVDQGTETVEALEEEIRRTGSIFLWWD